MPQMVSLISILIAFFALCKPSIACESEIGSMTSVQDVEVDSTIEITCTLKNDAIEINGEVYNVNASFLEFWKVDTTPTSTIDSSKIHVSATLESTLRINSSTVEDSGVYSCLLHYGNGRATICFTTVNVGYKPRNSSIDFRCISNYQTLECRWKTEPSKLETNSTLKDVSRIPQYNKISGKKSCPNVTRGANNDTWLCKWTSSSNPPFFFDREKFEFHVETKNRLGEASDFYIIKHKEIVLPDKPKNLTVSNITQNTVELFWSRPSGMKYFKYPLLYQITLKPQNQFTLKVINIEERSAKISYRVTGLVPNTPYDIVVRCRSPFAEGEDMWSGNITTRSQTMPDVPYLTPDITKQAFEVIESQHSCTIIIRWKHVPKKYWNGKDFQYKISVDRLDTEREENVTSLHDEQTVNATYAIFSSLMCNYTYHFKIFSANHKGSSRNFSSITVDSVEKLLHVPEDIIVISYSHGKYNISWKPPSINSSSIKSYTLFWCDKPRPYANHCEGPVYWRHVAETNEFLDIADEGRNFQFAVAANSDKYTSGMTWAPCIVSHDGTPHKPKLELSAKNSTTVHATLKLECKAQRVLIKELYIVYCRVPSKYDKNCAVPEIPEKLPSTSTEDYDITTLVPFTLYRVYIRMLTYDDRTIDSDIQYQQTLFDAPDDPPTKVKATSVTNSSIEISWKPPKRPNGNLTSYLFKYNEFSDRVNISTSNKVVLKKNIKPFTNYSILLRACNNDKCSPPSEQISVLTNVGIPGIVNALDVEIFNTSWATVRWDLPSNPNGPIDYYVLYVQPSEDHNYTDQSHTLIINNTEDRSALVSVNCPAMGKGIRYSFQLQPVNTIDNAQLYGPKTKPANRMMCLLYPDEGLSSAMIVSIIVGSAVGCALLLIIVYMFIMWMKKKYDLLKTIKVRLPTGLDTPNKYTPGTYQDFKKEFLQHCPYPIQMKQRQGSFNSDTIKNRHGSGNSQYSNLSTDELLMKRSSHCEIYRRNPSGDSSSGCSSTGGHDSISSSHTNQTHISADSGAEIDLSPLSVKDNVFSEEKSVEEPTIFIMPNVKEKSSSCNEHTSEHELEKHKMEACLDVARNVPPLYSAYIQPYSKFGVNQIKDGWIHNSPRQYNILAYASNLSNSEPSVAELDSGNIENYAYSLTPYSKFTFSKSMENICGNNIGYSKCSIIDDTALCNVPDSVKLTHFNTNMYQKDIRAENTKFISSKPYYVGIRTCLEDGSKPKIPALTENANSTVSSSVIDSMAYSKFDINPPGLLSIGSRTDRKTTAYIPLQQAMLQAMDITQCSTFDDGMDKGLSHSNVPLPAEIVLGAIVDPCVEQHAINRSSSVPLDHYNNIFFCTNHVGNQDVTPTSFSCDATDEKPNTSLSDINLNIDIRPGESHNREKLGTNEEQMSIDEQTLKSDYLKELGVVVSPVNLNCSIASVPEYRFHSQSDKVGPVNSKSGYINFSPVYYV